MADSVRRITGGSGDQNDLIVDVLSDVCQLCHQPSAISQTVIVM